MLPTNTQELVVRPIGFVHSPFVEKLSAPRQPYAARGVAGTIELVADAKIEHALEDLDTWDHIWVIFWFHLNQGWRPKVLPPRSRKRRGVFSTRSPHRPNPIGLSVVRLSRIEGRTLHICDIDLLDGTPVLDIKPYVPFADSIPDAKTGWLGAPDPDAGYEVRFSPLAAEQAEWLRARNALELIAPISEALRLGPEPHPYRRIKKTEQGYCLAFKAWRAHFRVEDRVIMVESLATGYRARELAESRSPELDVHRAFVEHFSAP